ncbi:MAG: EscU/YscU/HrcU family type III secretion system export apparatus switch protein, partial [Oscillospiraceae bacterium]
IKQKQRDMAMSRMIQQVPTADVVIRNPTHFAVAIKYDTEKSSAPIVVAKGQEQVALKIIEIATEHGVHVLENRPLARALFETVEISGEIPAEFYGPVAEILAFVYSLKEKDEK